MEYKGRINLNNDKKENEIAKVARQFWDEIESEVASSESNSKKTIDSTIIRNDPEKFETYIFANFDICNFTKYKREHSDWVELLQNFLYTVSNPTSDWSVSRFWKFNGDSLTFRKKVKSVDEICRFIKQTQGHLIQLQNFLNKGQKSYKKIYVKAAVWIAGFSNSDEKNKHIVNNTRFCRSPFGEEFVGENIDEGFRLSSCSKAGKLVVDPKIVLIVYLYSILCTFLEKKQKEIEKIRNLKDLNNVEYNRVLIQIIDDFFKQKQIYYNFEDEKTKNILLHISKELIGVDLEKFRELVSQTESAFYLMEYAKCKGVWDDRDYPIFWYVEDLQRCELVYDEIINGQNLRDHRLYKLINSRKTNFKTEENPDYCYFTNAKIQLINVCGQIEVLSSIKELVEHLTPYPLGFSEETIFDTANLYYMVACVIVKDGIDKGILIFKRSSTRKHLKFVWDFVPIKHARTYKTNEVYGICDYLENMLCKKLNFQNNKYEDSKTFTIKRDLTRDSIKPYAFCNVYRNGENHNGILCVAEVNVDSDLDEFLSGLTNLLKEDPQKQYETCRLITLDSIQNDDIVIGDELIIKSLSPYQVKFDSDNVAIDDSYVTFGPKTSDDNCEFGISYLGYSIKQILEERMYEQERDKRTP